MNPVIVAGWCAGWLLAASVRRFPRRDTATPPPVSVVVPARNEAGRLPPLLAALAGEPCELVVVDDASTDATAAVAHAAGATVVPVSPPPGWTGKAWACREGARVASGEVIVFLDADVVPEPGFVGRLAAEAARAGGLVSVQPWHDIRAVHEYLSAVPSTIALLGAGTGAAPRRRWWRGPVAFGPAMAVPRAVYHRAGGHDAVRDAIAEDLALARAFDAAGVPVAAWAGGGVRYRMYPEGVGTLAEGWVKNLAAGAGSIPLLRALLVFLWVAALLTAPFGGLVAYALVTVQAGVLFRRAGRFGAAAALAPLLAAAFVALFAASGYARLTRRRVAWRGRAVPARSER